MLVYLKIIYGSGLDDIQFNIKNYNDEYDDAYGSWNQKLVFNFGTNSFLLYHMRELPRNKVVNIKLGILNLKLFLFFRLMR